MRLLMVKFCFIVTAMLLTFTVSSELLADKSAISPGDVSGKPDVLCKVLKEPDPQLLGHWGCTHRTYYLKSGEHFPEPVEYWLVKSGDGYGLYFYRHKKGGERKKYKEWKKWTINGDVINSGAEVKIFTEDGNVYYQWKDDKPTRMTPIDDNR